MGPNGVGKSTFLGLLLGDLTPTRGEQRANLRSVIIMLMFEIQRSPKVKEDISRLLLSNEVAGIDEYSNIISLCNLSND